MNTLLWTQHSFCGSIPSPRHNHIFHTVDENQLILFGGWSRGWWNGELFDTYFNDVYLLDMEQKTWIQPPVSGTPPEPRASMCSSVIKRKLFIFGGGRKWSESGDSRLFNDFFLYDIDKHEWKALSVHGDIPPPREGHTAIEYDKKLYIFGGTDGHTNYSDLYVWDIERSECWRPFCSGEKPQPRGYHSMIRVGKRAYVFSGSCWDEFTGVVWDDFCFLDLESLTWHSLIPTNVNSLQNIPYAPSARFSVASGVLRNRIYYYGGWSFDDEGDSIYHSDLYVFDTNDHKWCPLDPVRGNSPSILIGSACATFQKNQLVFFGGHNSKCDTNTIYILSEETDPIPKPDSRLSTDFSSLVNNSEFADVQIVVDNKTILAHKAILSARCPHFAAYFRCEKLGLGVGPKTTEKSHTNNLEPIRTTIYIKDYSYDVVSLMIQFLYSGTLSETKLQDSDTVLSLLQLSDQYLINDLKEYLEYFLQGSVDVDNCCFLYTFAKKCNADRLATICQNLINKEFEQVQKTPEFQQLPAALLEQLTKRKKKRLSLVVDDDVSSSDSSEKDSSDESWNELQELRQRKRRKKPQQQGGSRSKKHKRINS